MIYQSPSKFQTTIKMLNVTVRSLPAHTLHEISVWLLLLYCSTATATSWNYSFIFSMVLSNLVIFYRVKYIDH